MPDSNASTPFVSTESRIILLTSMGHALCHISELAFSGLILAVVADFQAENSSFSVDQAALLTVPGFIIYGLGALPAGMWADRRGSGHAMKIYFAAVAVACLLIFLARSPLELCLGLASLGMAISIYHPAGLAMLSLGCANRGRALGINGVAGSLGVALGPSLGLLVLTQYSWRVTYLIIGGLAGLGFVCATLMPIDLPQVEPATRKSPGASKGSLPILAVLFAAMLVGGFNYRCLTTVLPAYLSGGGQQETLTYESGQLRDAEAADAYRSVAGSGGGIVFLVFALGGIGQLAGGFLADRYRPAVFYVLAIAATVPLALAIARLPLGLGTWLAGMLVVFMFAEQPFENTLIAEATPARYRSTIYGLKFVLAFGIASLGAYVAGLTWRFSGLVRVFDIFAGGAVLMATLAATFAIIYTRATVRTRIT